MSNKNSLANKKRKRIKYDATSGSITGFLLSSSENIELNNFSDNSLDTSEIPANQSKPIKGRLSLEFDDSFDLFATKKIVRKKSDDDVPSLKNNSPRKKINGVSPKKKSSPKNSNSGSPNVKSKSTKANICKKSDYFDTSLASVIPCPFCFKFEEDIYTHISKNCIRPSSISDSSAAELIKIHNEYWKQRRILGIPDLTLNEDEIFKPGVSQAQKLHECSNGSSSDCKAPVLKWNSKSKRSKYLLLRQSKTERECKITQKLAIVLMGNESAEEDRQKKEPQFQTIDKSLTSSFLSALLVQELTFWEKSRLSPNEITEEIYYIKALAPFIAPRKKKIKNSLSPVNEKKEEDDSEVAAIFNAVNKSPAKNISLSRSCAEQASEQESHMKDPSIIGTNPPLFTSNENKEVVTFSYYQTPLSKNWEKMYNTSDLSDTTVLFSDGHFLGHSLVFYTHSIKIFRSISSSSDEESGKLLDWKEIPTVVGRAFIKFIYTGEIQHFNSMNSCDLEFIKYLCEKYDEFNLEIFINNLIRSKNSMEETNPSHLSVNRDITSPDIFEDIDSSDSVINTTFTLTENRESGNTSASSKRKLELTIESVIANESSKRIKTESPILNGVNDEEKSSDVLAVNEHQMKFYIPVVTISSDDRASVSSAETMSPGRYGKLGTRPLSQCSTLPPLSESPKRDEKTNSPSSPPIFPDSPGSNKILTQNIENNYVERDSPKNLDDCYANFENAANQENNLYYDHDSFDYNFYLNSSWVDDIEEESNINLNKTKPDLNKATKEKVIPPPKNSLDKYFEDSLPANLIDNSDILCKTPQSIGKCVQGSPMCQSTPTQLIVTSNNHLIGKSVQCSPVCQSTPTQQIVTSNNLFTPSPQILVSDKVTPMLNYSNLISPELKGELRKYGLKPEMDRKKAKTLLRYIYDLIHPVVPGSDDKDSVLDGNQVASKTSVDDDVKYSVPLRIDSSDNKEYDDSKANSSTETIIVDNSKSKEEVEEFNFESSEDEVPCIQELSTYLSRNELTQAVSAFIKHDPVLFESILKYVPIWLSKFHQALKENGIKCTKVDLMGVLDEMCITFRTERKPREKK